MFAGPIVFVLFIVTSSFAEESSSNNVAREKRTPMGFQGMRGKRDPTSSENDEYSKRAPMGFQGMRGKKLVIGPNVDDNFLSENADNKRAPMGFQGMRGKKEYLAPVFEDSFYNEEYEKRAPMGFQGVRGKKTISDEDFIKRGPMGFQGVRGKKSFEEILEDMEKRALMGFHGMRGKKAYAFDYPEEYEKRALSRGFQGMRGKRSLQIESQEESQKGESAIELQRMRGKRSVGNTYGTSNEFAKSSTQNLQGSLRERGESAPNNFEKRSPYRYFENRGKKNPRWEIRGKFVGVRGKKWEASSHEDRIQLKKLFDNIEGLNRLPGSTSVLEMQ